MQHRDLILQHITEVFGNSRERVIAGKIIDFITTYTQTRHINLQLVRQITNEEDGQHDATIFRTLQCLAGDKIGLLETHFELVDENEVISDISTDDLKAVRHGIHPITGLEDDDIEKRVFVYYSPDPNFPQRLDVA